MYHTWVFVHHIFAFGCGTSHKPGYLSVTSFDNGPCSSLDSKRGRYKYYKYKTDDRNIWQTTKGWDPLLALVTSDQNCNEKDVELTRSKAKNIFKGITFKLNIPELQLRRAPFD